VLLTTHYLEEGDRCDRVGLLERGRLAALGSPESLKAEVGGEVVRLRVGDPEWAAARLRERLGIEAVTGPESLRFELAGAHERVVELIGALGDRVRSITVSRPSLEDVFVRRTGRDFRESVDGTRGVRSAKGHR
jgi:ABC-2 type transport system ATP-binding protein